jgi:hypothetical protein
MGCAAAGLKEDEQTAGCGLHARVERHTKKEMRWGLGAGESNKER